MRRSLRTGLLVPIAVCAVVCALVLRSDDWEPLAGWLGWIAIVLSLIGLGLTLRWWAIVAAPIVFVLAAVLVRPGDGEYATSNLVVLAAPATAVVAAIAALAGRWVRRPQPAAVLLATATVLVLIGLYLDARVVDHDPASPVALDLATGALPGVEPGSSASGLQERFGRSVVTSDLNEMAPLGDEPGDLSGPSSLVETFVIHRFERIAVFVHGGKVRGYVTTDRDVELAKGVGIGDSIDLIEDRGLPLRCSGVTLGSDSDRPAYPNCTKRLPGGARLIAGGDPIDSIWCGSRQRQ